MSDAPSGSHALSIISFVMQQQSMVNVTVQCCKISSSLNYDSEIFGRTSFRKTVHPDTMLWLCDRHWMTSPQTSGLTELDQLLGHLICLIWPH